MLEKSANLKTIGNGTFAPGTINQPKYCCDQQMNRPKTKPISIPKNDNNKPSKKKI
jgi:hypothetical protein